MKKIKNKIADILKEKNISPYRLAKLMNIPPITVYNWVNGKSNPSQRHLVVLMKILGVTLEDILEVQL